MSLRPQRALRQLTSTARASTRLQLLTSHSSSLQAPSTLRAPSLSRKMSSIPSSMKAVSFSKTGGPDVLDYKTDTPVPQPKEGEVLVKNNFAGVNYVNLTTATTFCPLLVHATD
jgi:hypothetical protein